MRMFHDSQSYGSFLDKPDFRWCFKVYFLSHSFNTSRLDKSEARAMASQFSIFRVFNPKSGVYKAFFPVLRQFSPFPFPFSIFLWALIFSHSLFPISISLFYHTLTWHNLIQKLHKRSSLHLVKNVDAGVYIIFYVIYLTLQLYIYILYRDVVGILTFCIYAEWTSMPGSLLLRSPGPTTPASTTATTWRRPLTLPRPTGLRLAGSASNITVLWEGNYIFGILSYFYNSSHVLATEVYSFKVSFLSYPSGFWGIINKISLY